MLSQFHLPKLAPADHVKPNRPAAALCYGLQLNFGNCAPWQHGIGASSTDVIGINQISAVELRFNLNWISPYEWATNPPQNVESSTPILYEECGTLNTCSMDLVNGYDY